MVQTRRIQVDLIFKKFQASYKFSIYLIYIGNISDSIWKAKLWDYCQKNSEDVPTPSNEKESYWTRYAMTSDSLHWDEVLGKIEGDKNFQRRSSMMISEEFSIERYIKMYTLSKMCCQSVLRFCMYYRIRTVNYTIKLYPTSIVFYLYRIFKQKQQNFLSYEKFVHRREVQKIER